LSERHASQVHSDRRAQIERWCGVRLNCMAFVAMAQGGVGAAFEFVLNALGAIVE